jgi:hypothetical protein
MSLVISKVFTYDTDAGDYIQRVEGASGDNQALEPATRQAINNFVIGCKQDGIWNAIKASCILSGARTLNGALQPLAGTAPTNVGPFVTGDYNRKTGLLGNGTTKYLDSNRNNNADPQDSVHKAVYIGQSGYADGTFISSRTVSGANNGIENIDRYLGVFSLRSRAENDTISITTSALAGFLGTSRSNSTTFNARLFSNSVSKSGISTTPSSGTITLYTRIASGSPYFNSNARLAFYSIGESLDLALLDARVTALITAFGVAIP